MRRSDFNTLQSKRTMIYLAPDLHKALRLKAISVSESVSGLVNDVVREALAEDAEDLAAFEVRKKEPLIRWQLWLKWRFML